MSGFLWRVKGGEDKQNEYLWPTWKIIGLVQKGSILG